MVHGRSVTNHSAHHVQSATFKACCNQQCLMCCVSFSYHTESTGFEPVSALTLPPFQSGAFSLSATIPRPMDMCNQVHGT